MMTTGHKKNNRDKNEFLLRLFFYYLSSVTANFEALKIMRISRLSGSWLMIQPYLVANQPLSYPILGYHDLGPNHRVV